MTEKETTALALLKEYWAFREGDKWTPQFHCGTAYISRAYADTEKELFSKWREFFAEVDNSSFADGEPNP